MSELDDAPSPLVGDSPAPSMPEYLSSDNALTLRQASEEPWTSPFNGRENRVFQIFDIHNRDHGSVGVEYDPQSGDVRVHSMDARNLDRGLTHVHAADLLYDLRQVYPQARSISGLRVTGARGSIRPETKIPWPQETDSGTPGRRASALPAPPPESARAPMTAPPTTGSPPGGYESPEMVGHIHRMLGPSRLDDSDARSEKTP